jgi:hypothetical protein
MMPFLHVELNLSPPGPSIMGVGGHLNHCVPYPSNKPKPRLNDLPLPKNELVETEYIVHPKTKVGMPGSYVPHVYWVDATDFFKDCKTGAKLPDCVWLSK